MNPDIMVLISLSWACASTPLLPFVKNVILAAGPKETTRTTGGEANVVLG
jgi:hypothetical protein